MRVTRRSIQAAVGGVMLTLAIVSRVAVQAAPLTLQKDIMSRQLVSVAADHEIHFTTPSGVTVPGATMTLAFASGFSLAAIAVADVQLTHGPVTGAEIQEKLAASATANVWGLSVSNQILTLTAPTNATSGTIVAGQAVMVRIGLNAGGSHQIANPAAAGLYGLTLSGSFGDSGRLSLPISATDTANVTALVPPAPPSASTGGTGGGGSLLPADNTIDASPILFSNLRVFNTTQTATDIAWTTNRQANASLKYGPDMQYEAGAVSDGAYLTDHLVHLTGLTPGNLYHFVAMGTDTMRTSGRSDDQTFQTLPTPQAPRLLNAHVASITDTTAALVWDTDIPATSLVRYGETISYDGSQADSGLVLHHAVLLTGLRPATIYHLKFESAEAGGLATTSLDQTLTTLASATVPNVSDFHTVLRGGELFLAWTNPSGPTLAKVVIVARTDRFSTGVSDGRMIYTGTGTTAPDSGAELGSTYFYTAYVIDEHGQPSSGALLDFTFSSEQPTDQPLPEQQPPLPGENPPGQSAPGRNGRAGRGRPRQITTPAQPGQLGQPTLPTQPGGISGDHRLTFGFGGPDASVGGDIFASGTQPTSPPIISLTPTGLSPSATPGAGSVTGVVNTSSGINPLAQSTSATSSLSATAATAPLPVRFYQAQGSLELSPDDRGNFAIVIRQPVTLRVPVVGLAGIPSRGVLLVANARYALQQTSQGDAWTATFVPGTSQGTVAVQVQLQFPDGLVREHRATFVLSSFGHVREEAFLGGAYIPIAGAEVTLFDQRGQPIRLPAGADNPVFSGAAGGYVFIVPSGAYRLEAKKSGYKTKRIPVTASHDYVAVDVALAKLPKPLSQVIDPQASLAQNIGNVSDEAGLIITAGLENVRTPAVQQVTNQVVAPTVVVAAVASSATAVSAFNLFNYLRFLITQPLMLINRRKRRKWGVVYHALTKLPLELVIVRLLQADTGLLVQTRITDSQGRYSFIARPGRYRLEVIKPKFLFPSRLLQGESQDVSWADLYHGEIIEAKQDGVMLAMNIPIDPIEHEETPKIILFKRALRKAQDGIGFGSVVLTMAALILAPGALMAVALLGQVGFYLIARRLSLPPKPKGWGLVVDEHGKAPLERSIVRIFDKKFNKLLETQVTTKSGTYGFFVGKNIYYVTAEHPGYAKYVSADVDLREKKESLIDQQIVLKKV